MTKQKADKLLADLNKEDENDEKNKAKAKAKKWRNKINRIAKAEKITPEEVEARLEKEAAQQRIDEERKVKEEKEREL